MRIDPTEFIEKKNKGKKSFKTTIPNKIAVAIVFMTVYYFFLKLVFRL